MTRFKFRLQPLLMVRESTRDRMRVELAQAHEALRTVEQKQAELQQEQTEMRNALQNALRPGALPVDRILSLQRYQASLQIQQHGLEHQRKQVEQEMELRRQRLTEADREVRVLEKLREKQQLRHAEEESRQEAQEMNEVALQRHHRAEVSP